MNQEFVADEARAQTEAVLREKYDDCIRVTHWNSDVIGAIWSDPKFEWEHYAKRAFGYQELKLAFWCGDRLFLMAVATVAGNNLLLRHIEANPDEPLFEGQRLFMVLEALVRYASGLASRRWKIVTKPETQDLLNFLVRECGFVEGDDGQCYLELEAVA